MKVKDIIDRVTDLYNDKEYIRIPIKGYFRFLDDATNQIVFSRPDANVAHEIVKLVPGTQQRIPDKGYTFIDIYMNKKPVYDSTGGITDFINYRPVFQVDRKDLDYYDNWQGSQAPHQDYINEFAYDARSPRIFWVTPFVSDTIPVYVEMDYSFGLPKYSEMNKTPEEIMEMDIPMSEIFRNPLISYMLYLLYSTDSTSVVDRQVAATYESSFYQALGLEYNAVQIANPRIEDAQIAAAIRENS